MKESLSAGKFRFLRRIRVKTKCWFELDGKILFGSGKARLFRMIAQHGSINAGAKAMGISYRQAWQHIRQMEEAMSVKLIEKNRGGAGGGGSRITATGELLLKTYDEMSLWLKEESGQRFERLSKKAFEGGSGKQNGTMKYGN